MRRGLSERGFPNAVIALASRSMCMKVPGPASFPVIGSTWYLLRHGGPSRMVQVLQRLYADHGSIVRLSAPAQEAVIIFDPEVYMDVHRAGGSCPWGATDALWPLHEYFRLRVAPLPSGQPMAFGSGDWMRVRRGMQKSFFAPRYAAEYSALNAVARDAARKLGGGGGSAGGGLQHFLQRLSFEMICSALLGRRMGALEGDEPLLAATVRSMECASSMLMSPLQHWHARLNTPTWRGWVASLDFMLLRSHEHVSACISHPTPSYVDALLRRGELTAAEISANVPGLMMAGFETVAATLHWTLLHLALQPAAQERLHAELSSVLGRDADPCRESVQRMPYLRAVLREVQRLTPTAFSFLRRLPDPLEVQLPSGGAARLPSGAWLAFSPVGLATDPAHVAAPTEFRPERWVDAAAVHRERAWPLFDHPLMRDGFSHGPRMCLGARIAQLELWLAVSQIVRAHRLRVDGPRHYAVANHASTYPNPAPRIVFEPR
mmetsp:Transcript_3804/g.11216  ORF Transcript_3804/g.11216 Transcript_3804/m.11216 type:complete len:491 (+) Transcript_3804:87-1559(+)